MHIRTTTQYFINSHSRLKLRSILHTESTTRMHMNNKSPPRRISIKNTCRELLCFKMRRALKFSKPENRFINILLISEINKKYFFASVYASFRLIYFELMRRMNMGSRSNESFESILLFLQDSAKTLYYMYICITFESTVHPLSAHFAVFWTNDTKPLEGWIFFNFVLEKRASLTTNATWLIHSFLVHRGTVDRVYGSVQVGNSTVICLLFTEQ
jgi:hypothetical protein